MREEEKKGDWRGRGKKKAELSRQIDAEELQARKRRARERKKTEAAGRR